MRIGYDIDSVITPMINRVFLEERGVRMLTEEGSIFIDNDSIHFESSRLQGTSPVYDIDRQCMHISPLELLNNIVSRLDTTMEDYSETKKLRDFLDGFQIKEAS